MKRPWVDKAWRLAVALFAEILNPLLVIWPALFVSAGYALSLLMPLQIGHWTTLLAVTLLTTLTTLLARFWASLGRLCRVGGSQIHAQSFNWRALLPVVPLLIFAPLFYGELADPAQQIIGHTDLHMGYVNQLLHGATPLESVHVVGNPVNYYWLYHAPIAALVKATGLPAALLASLLNLVAISCSLVLLSEIVVWLGLAEARTLRLGCLVVLAYCSLNIFGAPTLVARMLEGPVASTGPPREMLLPGADKRLHSMMAKVMNFSSMAIAVHCYIAALHICLRFLRGSLDGLRLTTLSACVILCLAVRPLAAISIGLAILGGLAASGIVYGLARRLGGASPFALLQQTARRMDNRFLTLWFVASVCLALPLLQYVLSFTAQYQSGIQLEWTSYHNVVMLVAALQIFLPLFALQLWLAWRERNWMALFVSACGLIQLGMAATLRMTDEGQYKLVFFASIPVALGGLLALRQLAIRWDGARWQPIRWLTVCLFALACAKVAIVTQNYHARAGRMQIAYEGSRFVYLDGYLPIERLAAYAWIRAHAPHEAVVVMPDEDWLERALHGRLLYVWPSDSYAGVFADFYPRIRHLWQLYGPEPMAMPLDELLSAMQAQLPGRPLYAVLSDSQVAPDAMMKAGATPVFVNERDGAHVYLLGAGGGDSAVHD